MKILIIGAGLGGLAAAVALRSESTAHEVLVVDSAPELAEIGAGLQLTPNATRLLARWGLRSHIESLVTDPQVFSVLRYSDGKVLAERQKYGEEMLSKYKANFWDIHRADLQIALFRRAEELGVEFRFNSLVKEHDFDNCAITLSNGDRLEGDLIIAADGLHSGARAAFQGAPSPPIPTGDLAYRIILKAEDIEDPKLKEFCALPRVCCWVGPGSHVMYYPLKNNTLCNLVLLVPDDLPPNVARMSGELHEMHAIFDGWDPKLRKLLSYVTDKKVDKWKLMHLEEMDRWFDSRSTIVFLGDACHPMLPYMAQGAGSALEDGAALGMLLSYASSTHDLPKVLTAYEELRKPRSAALQRGSMQQRYYNHLDDGPDQEARDKMLEEQFAEPKPGFPFYWLDPTQQEYVYGYDVVAEKIGFSFGNDSQDTQKTVQANI